MEVLDPEDHVLGKIEKSLEVMEGSSVWKEQVSLEAAATRRASLEPRALPFPVPGHPICRPAGRDQFCDPFYPAYIAKYARESGC